jgi:hypothetical protein
VGFINAALHYRIEMPMIAIEKNLTLPFKSQYNRKKLKKVEIGMCTVQV